MRSGVRNLSWMLAASLLAVGACGSDPPNTVPNPSGGSGRPRRRHRRPWRRGGSAGGTTGGSAGGTTGGSAGGTTGGSAGGATGGSAAVPAEAPAAAPAARGGTGTGGSAGSTGGSAGGAGGSATDGPPAEMPTTPTGDWMGYPGVPDLSQVAPTAGCGKAPTDHHARHVEVLRHREHPGARGPARQRGRRHAEVLRPASAELQARQEVQGSHRRFVLHGRQPELWRRWATLPT